MVVVVAIVIELDRLGVKEPLSIIPLLLRLHASHISEDCYAAAAAEEDESSPLIKLWRRWRRRGFPSRHPSFPPSRLCCSFASQSCLQSPLRNLIKKWRRGEHLIRPTFVASRGRVLLFSMSLGWDFRLRLLLVERKCDCIMLGAAIEQTAQSAPRTRAGCFIIPKQTIPALAFSIPSVIEYTHPRQKDIFETSITIVSPFPSTGSALVSAKSKVTPA